MRFKNSFRGVGKFSLLATALTTLSSCGLLQQTTETVAQPGTDIFANPAPLTSAFGAVQGQQPGAFQQAGQNPTLAAGFQQIPGAQTLQTNVAQQGVVQQGGQQGILPNAVAGFQQAAPEYQVSSAAWGQQQFGGQQPTGLTQQQTLQQLAAQAQSQIQAQQNQGQQLQYSNLQFPQTQFAQKLPGQLVQGQLVQGQVAQQPVSFEEFVQQKQAAAAQSVPGQVPTQTTVSAFGASALNAQLNAQSGQQAGQQAVSTLKVTPPSSVTPPTGIAPNPYTSSASVSTGAAQKLEVSGFSATQGAEASAETSAFHNATPYCADLGELNAQVAQILAPISVLPYGNELGNGIAFEIPFQTVPGGKSIANAEYVLPAIAQLVKPYDTMFVQVIGHTDKTGKDAVELIYTDTLSIYIAKQLADNGVEPRRIQTRGFGSRRPSVFGNNERAEFRLTTAQNCSIERIAARAEDERRRQAAFAAQQEEYAAFQAQQQQQQLQAQQQYEQQLQAQQAYQQQLQAYQQQFQAQQFQQQQVPAGQFQQFAPAQQQGFVQQGAVVQQQFDPYAANQQIVPQYQTQQVPQQQLIVQQQVPQQQIVGQQVIGQQLAGQYNVQGFAQQPVQQQGQQVIQQQDQLFTQPANQQLVPQQVIQQQVIQQQGGPVQGFPQQGGQFTQPGPVIFGQ